MSNTPTDKEVKAYGEQWRESMKQAVYPWLSDQDFAAMKHMVEVNIKNPPPSVLPWWETTPGAHMVIHDLEVAGDITDALLRIVVPDATISPGQRARWEHKDLARMTPLRLWQERRRVEWALTWADEALPEVTWLLERSHRIVAEEQRRAKDTV